MTVFGILFSYCLCLTVAFVSCRSMFPLLFPKIDRHAALHSRQKRHTPLDTTKLCKAFGCKNGHCKESELRKYRIVCECFTGFKGTLCDRPQCPYSCGKHGKCVKNGRSLRCQCEAGYFGLTCNKVAPINTSVLHSNTNGHLFTSLKGMVIPSTFRTSRPMFKINQMKGWFGNSISSKLSDIKFSDFHSHAVVDTSVKPDVCAPGFQCYHGNCDREALAYQGLFQCICKNNYTGLFCEKRCTLKCKNGGNCMVLDDGHQICSCPYTYTGHYCEKLA